MIQPNGEASLISLYTVHRSIALSLNWWYIRLHCIKVETVKDDKVLAVFHLGPVEALHGGLRLEVLLRPEAIRQHLLSGGAQTTAKPERGWGGSTKGRRRPSGWRRWRRWRKTTR